MDSSTRNQTTADGTSINLEIITREKGLESNGQESIFHRSGSFAASEISHVDDDVQFDSENDVRCAQGQEFEMVKGCNSTCHENLRKQSASTSCLTQPLLKNILDAMETKLEAFRRTIKAELGRPDHPDSPPKWFLEYMEVCRFNGDKEEVASTVIGELRHIRQQMSSQTRKMDEFLDKAESANQHILEFTCAELQSKEIRLQNALTELEITRAEMVKVQRESVRKLALESSKHAEEIYTFEKNKAATAHVLEQFQTEARLLKSSLEISLSKNEISLVQLGKTKGQLEEALDRENSLKLQLKELQNQLYAVVKKKDEDSFKHAEEISSLEEKNTGTVHALEQTQTEASQPKSSLESSVLKNESDLMELAKTKGHLEEALAQENVLEIELKKLQNEVEVVDESRPEATFRHVISNFSKANTEMSLSNATMVRNLPWRIMTRFAFGGRFFSFFLQANADVIWSCQAVAELRIVSQKKGVESLTHKIQHRFCLENNKDGFNIRKDIILNPENGYIKDDCVILEVHLVAEDLKIQRFPIKGLKN